jgi:hypothetical protein
MGAFLSAFLADSAVSQPYESVCLAPEISPLLPEGRIDIMLLAHISPIAWSNVILYGEYKLNKDMVR